MKEEVNDVARLALRRTFEEKNVGLPPEHLSRGDLEGRMEV